MRRYFFCLIPLSSAVPVLAQQNFASLGAVTLPLPKQSTSGAQITQTAESTVGRAGERQTRDQTKGIEPLARINGRIANRVESRIRNRIDRTFNAKSNAE